jgi:hypothetical protein
LLTPHTRFLAIKTLLLHLAILNRIAEYGNFFC